MLKPFRFICRKIALYNVNSLCSPSSPLGVANFRRLLTNRMSCVSSENPDRFVSSKYVQVCRLMLPDDANPSGNVHGGTILKMIEEAGSIVTTRYCNMNKEEGAPNCLTALARVERTDFLQPMLIGEVAQLYAEITYTAPRSLEVVVRVWAENVVQGTGRLTNKAMLWYVPLTSQQAVVAVPPMQLSPEAEAAGRMSYERQLNERKSQLGKHRLLSFNSHEIDELRQKRDLVDHTPQYSQSMLSHLVGPSDCVTNNFCRGGVTMKLMDEVAGIVAARHCKTNIVTASLDITNFHCKVKKGSLLQLTGIATFTSPHSMEIEVLVDSESLFEGKAKKERAVTAFFTYVSLGPNGKPQPIPLLKVQSPGEKQRFEEGKARYLERKALRDQEKQRKKENQPN